MSGEVSSLPCQAVPSADGLDSGVCVRIFRGVQ